MGKLLCKHLGIVDSMKTEIVVERNLSFSWYKDAPLMDVRLWVHPVEVSVTVEV